MQNSEVQSRLLLLLQLLLEQTDEIHSVSSGDILQFWASNGIQANRKNVYSDIQLLMDFGLDVICVRSAQNRYFIGSRLLELPELKLLVDAVESSHLITEKKSAALIEKLGHLTSRHNAALLNRPVYMGGTATPCSRSFDFQGSVSPDKNQFTEKRGLLPYVQDVGIAHKNRIFPRSRKRAIMKKILKNVDERGCFDVHKTVNPGTAQRPAGGG